MSKTPKSNSGRDVPEPQNAEHDEWLALHSRGDRVGLYHLEAARLKRKRKLTAEERKFLAEFEAERESIRREPEAAWQRGLQMALDGIRLLEAVFQERWTPGQPETNDPSAYNAICGLSLLADGLRRSFIRYAEDGFGTACQVIFRDGKELASAFSRLAVARPELFREFAEVSLTMPSLRARDPQFTCDAEAITAAVQLAAKHHAPGLHDNRTRIGALCHQLVAEWVDLIAAVRLELPLRGGAAHRYASLPELGGNAQAWWAAVLKGRVRQEFARLRRNPLHNPALRQELERLTDHGTESAQRAALEKYCFNKLQQIAGKAVQSG